MCAFTIALLEYSFHGLSGKVNHQEERCSLFIHSLIEVKHKTMLHCHMGLKETTVTQQRPKIDGCESEKSMRQGLESGSVLLKESAAINSLEEHEGKSNGRDKKRQCLCIRGF